MRTAWALLAISTLGCTVAAGARLNAGVVGPPVPAPVAAGAAATAQVEVRVSFFGIPLDAARDVVFVLDRSGSMGDVSTGFSGQAVGMSRTTSTLTSIGASVANSVAGGPLPSKLEVAKSELVRTLRAMPDGTPFNIIFFDHHIAAFSPTMVVLDPSSRAAAEAFIAGIRPGGSTAEVPALRLAYRCGAARVILLSDGLANTGGGRGELLAEARGEMARGVRFDVVGVGLDQDARLLTTLAAESGGMAVMR